MATMTRHNVVPVTSLYRYNNITTSCTGSSCAVWGSPPHRRRRDEEEDDDSITRLLLVRRHYQYADRGHQHPVRDIAQDQRQNVDELQNVVRDFEPRDGRSCFPR